MTDNTQTSVLAVPSGSSSALESASKGITLVAALALPCSVVYDWAYYSRLGLELAQVPTTLSDHARTAVNWLPAMVLATAITIALHLAGRRLDGWADPAELYRGAVARVATARWHKRMFVRIFVSPYSLLWTGAVVNGGAFLYYGGGQLGGFLVATAALLGLLLYLVLPPIDKAPKWLVSQLRIAILFGPMLAASAFSAGDRAAVSALKENPTASVTLTNNQVLSKMVVLRYLDKGVLVKRSDSHLLFVLWSSISEIDDARQRSTIRGLRCIWFASCDDTRALIYQPASN
ncbi:MULTISPECIES: hypothetical protein [Burkholderia cepacia complex]|uniref:hypothetical protein n=1 Tax=Burkholderia cepacia complex TaxID=87882 RepID=UPI0008897241|nr:hypothetical protein [Burkholderia cenocepacia]MBR8076079.1 hypothetical protein [Burkholderia cenocepacia]MBR8507406.1 hypothetical protein [Burkholderia cenocepacia]SDR54670.1 hypothetical protein SAMN05443026_5829 [Burkholderia orbicola]